MKFGAYLSSHLHQEWADDYINYKKLKDMIKALAEVENSAVFVPDGQGGAGERVTSLSMQPNVGTSSVKGKFKGKDITESDFFLVLEGEMKKVDKFTTLKIKELRKQVDVVAKKVLEGNKISSMTKEEKDELSQQAKQIGDEFLVLEKYVNLNFLGFAKILKKHDKKLPIPCQGFYMTRLHNQSWIKHDYSKLFVVLSKVHAKLRGDVAAKQQSTTGQSFVRTTTKYWVKTADISRVKHIVLQNLPVFQHQLERLEGDSQLTNSVYFDNSQLELYHGRLDKTPSAIAVRFRWYETETPNLVFVERKTHHDSWTGDQSVKERFTLKEKQVLPFLNGEFTIEDKLKEMDSKGASEMDKAAVRKLFTEIHNQIDSKQLRPTMRTQYMRVAYQIPFDPTVRISLDTNLTMITENPKFGVDCLTAGRWYRDPEVALPPTEYTIFPHAVFELKLSLKPNQSAPQWVEDLLNSGLLYKVHKFSKFIHGCATLLSKSVQAVPYWVDEESIRTSMLRSLPREKRRMSTVDAKEGTNLLGFGERENFSLIDRKNSIQDVGEEGVKVKDLKHIPREQEGKSGKEVTKVEEKQYVGNYGSIPTEKTSLLGRITKVFTSDNDDASEYYERNKAAYKVRKTPMKIEPKVFFANERTFLSWVHMSITLGSISALLLSFSAEQSTANKLSGDAVGVVNEMQQGARATKAIGMILMPVSVLFVAYALFVFHWRGKHIRARIDNDMFHDTTGPVVLGTVLLISLTSILFLFFFENRVIKF
eukprot:snap_masked-scaffold_13-processed-gene-9.48-mRNA-1 protein AED:0.01 eAED:0.01 QI:0/-1/0/1/-1/1/1/0/761